MVDDVTLAISIAALVVSVVATIPLYLDYFTRRSEKRVEQQVTFEVERFQESVTSPIESTWSIRVLNPSQTIEHCAVQLLYSSTNSKTTNPVVFLPIWNRKEVRLETKIAKDGAANFRIPKAINPFGTTVVVMDRLSGAVQIRDFREIPETNA